MLSRHVNPNCAKVLQLGGTTRDIFYYPKNTIQVKILDTKPHAGPLGLWDQAGIQAGIPVNAVEGTAHGTMTSCPGSAFDSVVMFNQLSVKEDVEALVMEAYRILKPGGTLIFVQRMQSSSALSLLVRIGEESIGSKNSTELLGVHHY
jgi:SAM-dependent methyltransferase